MPAFFDWFTHSGHQSTGRSCQLEGEDEIGYGFEVGPKGDKLIDDVFQTNYVSSDMFLDELVGVDEDSLISSFAEHFFIDEFLHDLGGRLTISDIILNSFKLLEIGRGPLHKDSRVYGFELELVQNQFLGFWNIGDTPDS